MKASDEMREAAMNLANNKPVESFVLDNYGNLIPLSWAVRVNGIPWTVGWLMYRADQLDGLS